MKENLNYSDYEIMFLNEQPIDTCQLTDAFICTNSDSLTMFSYSSISNENVLGPLRKIQIHGAYGCAVNEKENEIYISDKVSNYVYKMDANLKQIGKYGSTGNGQYELNSPHGISFNYGFLFICDYKNKRVQILDSNLQFSHSLPLDFSPISIALSNNGILGICGDNETCFFDVESLTLIRVFPDYSGRINFIKPNFYVVSNERTYIFDNVGNIVDEIEMNRFRKFLNEKMDGHIFFHEDNFFISSASTYRFLRFKN